MSKSKRITAALLAMASLISLAGCSTSMTGGDAASYPLVPALTESEVAEYYAESMSFDAIVSKNLDVDTVRYETKPIPEEDTAKLQMLSAALNNTEAVLNRMKYVFNEETDRALNETTFHYIKSYLNDRKLDNREVTSVTQAMGYYFIDVKYDISARSAGSFTGKSSLLGLNGAFTWSEYYQQDLIDDTYLTQAVETLNEYYKTNRILNKKASYDSSAGVFSTSVDGSSMLDFTNSTVSDDSIIDTGINLDGIEQPTEGELNEEWQPVEGEIAGEGTPVETPVETPTEPVTNFETVTQNGIRSPNIDISEFNTVVGSSIKETAYMPDLEMVYNIPESDGYIGGIGILPVGIGGLNKFNFNREDLAGTVTLRYVYKQDLLDPNKVHNINVYPVFSEITTGFAANNDRIIADWLMVEFEKLIERADRAIANTDMSGLMSGNIFADMGMAVLRGYENQYVNVLRQMSTVRRVISRDVSDSSYLIEVETLRQEGPKGADVYGTYRDIAYVVIEQNGQDFVITDWLNMTRKLQTEPEINPDSAVTKRLVALGLAGEVTEPVKENVKELLNSLYSASTNRVITTAETGPKTIATANGDVVIEKGMYDCFNQNEEMLSQTKRDELNSRLRALLVKHGTAVGCTLNGTVTEWIGGADNQVEFMTEEILTYQGRSDGIHLTCYYLVSNMEDIWVIDDLQIVKEEEISGAALTDAVNRINSANS